ncbi:hypothetical protein K8R47_02380 [archaeon]|nr:hypothetical protein [archaeon]
MKLKQFLKPRILILIFVILLSILIINPNLNPEGVAIRGVETNSSAAFAGISSNSDVLPTDREIIREINNQEIINLEDYSNILDSIENGDALHITTDKSDYSLLKTANLGLTVSEIADSNIIKGLELQGGTRVLLEPDQPLSNKEISEMIQVMENRFNVYGLSDITIKQADDLLGNKFIIVEIAGATKEEVENLVSEQGVFEAKIGDDVVFEGGNKDVPFVCRGDGTCSGIRACNQVESGYQCRFEFSIKLSESAAKKHAEVTSELDINYSTSGTSYLSKPLDLYLDNNLVDSLNIGSDLKGQEARDISISGPGFGNTEQEALDNALDQMNHLQTVLITGSLPVKLNIVQTDSISPVLGKAFLKNIFLVALLSILAVALVIFIRYRKLKIAVPIIIVSASEILIILGLAALIRYNLDLAAIAGIIATVGTGVDHQIVIADEVLSKKESYYNWKDKMKKAFFIIMIAYATTVAAMIPLLKAGAGLLTGFAFVTIAGVTIGVFITRPAFGAIIKILLQEN